MKKKYFKTDYSVRTLIFLLRQKKNKTTDVINKLIDMIVTPDDFNRATRYLRPHF